MQGNKLGPYSILEQLGAGGMGEVWLAEDSRLGRKVAIKVLPAAVATDPERLQRFEQEARASAALNHPNIAVVHDVGADTDESGATVHYMVQEYLQGETLRDRIDRGPLKTREAVELARQIAGALAAAHAAGIVHRDLKPDNLFLVAPDHIKVLDFGLAKLTEAASVGPVDATMSPTYVGTTVGQLLGTAGYMAPEQVRGESVDHRADLFAFGCVLHEMLTGQRAFAGRSVHQTLDLILSEEPAAPTEPERALSPALEWIRRKCLAKEASRRYQHADELAVDLARFGEDLASGKIEAARTAGGGAVAEASVAPGRTGVVAALLSPAGLVALLAAAAGAVLITLWFVAPAAPAAELIALTEFSTRAGTPALSPDGRLLAFVAEEPQSVDSQIWVRTLPDGPPLQLTDTPGAKDMPAFSPDGSRIAYTVIGDEWQYDTWIVPIVGGEPRLMLRNANSLTWAPDGRVIYSEFRQGAQLAIVISDESGAGKQDVWVPNVDQMAHFSRVSPDGSQVVIGYMGEGEFAPGRSVACFVRDLEDTAAEVRLVGSGEVPCLFFARYSPDGQWIYFVAHQAPGVLAGIYREPAGGGRAELIYSGDNAYNTGGFRTFALTADGAVILSAGIVTRDIWVQDADGVQRQLTYASEASDPVVSPDGRQVFYVGAGRDGEGLVWMLDRDTGRREQICLGRTAGGLSLSPDGRYLALSGGRGNGRSTWLCAIDGASPVRPLGDPEQLRAGAFFSHDGETVYQAVGDRQEGDDVEFSIWASPIDRQESRHVADLQGFALPVSISPDGEWLSVSDVTQSPRETWLYRTGGDADPRVVMRGWDLYWAPDGSTWMFNNGGMVATTWILENPDGRLLPEGLPEYPTGAWFESAGARRVLVGGNFSLAAISNVPYEIVFERLTGRSNLFRLDLPE